MAECDEYSYDVVLSFAGEDRQYVQKVARYLKNSGIRVFYDDYEGIGLWGKDLYQHLDAVYQKKARYAVIFISEAYARKLWTSHELKSAQTRAFSENQEYILPARFDNTEIPGIRNTIGYIDLTKLKPSEFAKKIIEKIGYIKPKNFLPDKIPFVIQTLQAIYETYDEDTIEADVRSIFTLLEQTSVRERHLIACLAVYGCHLNIENDVHEDLSYIARVSNYAKGEIVNILNGLSNLGFEYKINKRTSGSRKEGNRQTYEQLSVTLTNLRAGFDYDNANAVMLVMFIGATRNYCAQHGIEALCRLDFSDLKDDVSPELLELIESHFSESGTHDCRK